MKIVEIARRGVGGTKEIDAIVLNAVHAQSRSGEPCPASTAKGLAPPWEKRIGTGLRFRRGSRQPYRQARRDCAELAQRPDATDLAVLRQCLGHHAMAAVAIRKQQLGPDRMSNRLPPFHRSLRASALRKQEPNPLPWSTDSSYPAKGLACNCMVPLRGLLTPCGDRNDQKDNYGQGNWPGHLPSLRDRAKHGAPPQVELLRASRPV